MTDGDVLDANAGFVTGDVKPVSDVDGRQARVKAEGVAPSPAGALVQNRAVVVLNRNDHLGVLRREGMELRDLEPDFIASILAQEGRESSELVDDRRVIGHRDLRLNRAERHARKVDAGGDGVARARAPHGVTPDPTLAGCWGGDWDPPPGRGP